jgi:ketosteroid isomerase-like protein
MSPDNVESLRAFLEAWGREPWTPAAWEGGTPIDMSFFDPEVVYEDTILPDHVGEAYRGHEGVSRAAQRWIEGNEWLLFELERIVGAGDHLVSIQRARSKARYSGIEIDVRFAYAWTFRDGRAVRFKSFLDPDDALEAVGLRE